jgi:DNA-binding NarL/FixJ family response regulator
MEPCAGAAESVRPIQRSIDRKTTRRILIADPHRLVAEALAERFQRERWADVVGVATTHDGALSRASDGAPDVMLLEVSFDGSIARDLCEQVALATRDVRFVFLSSNTSEVALKQALDLSAGYLLKTEPLEHVVKAIGAMSNGSPPFSREIEKRIKFDRDRNEYVLKHPTPISELTTRQIEVLRHLAWGTKANRIGELLGITPKGVESHKYRIMHKLKIYDRGELMQFAIREGIASL